MFKRLIIFSSLPKSSKKILPRNIITRNMSHADESPVILETINNRGLITMNRPKALHSLNLEMVRTIFPQLKKWEEDKAGFAMIKSSGGKAFCAGGDVVQITSDQGPGNQFFKEEYTLNHAIGTLKIPYIALIDGYTFGGGVGLSVHGTFRVSTENTVLAMPETSIGLFPDVGGGHFLSRLEDELGTFAALTGYRLKARDVYHAGISTHHINASMLEEVQNELFEMENVSESNINSLLNSYHNKCSTVQNTEFSLANLTEKIHSIFSGNSVEEILDNLRKDQSEFAEKQLKLLSRMSPTSLKITLQQLRLGKHLNLADNLKMEYRIGSRCLLQNDFKEGVRALLLDKDNKPNWKPDQLSKVNNSDVEYYFKSFENINDELVL